MDLSQSQNYIWSTESDEDLLGEGTFGKVYRGVHKRTGDKVAVKIFKHGVPQRNNEIDLLQSLKHQYIIQMYGIESEQTTDRTIMVMELCNGGSLMDFLQEPENTHGLSDSEFLLVLEHLSGGLEYLKRQNVIHRDVKPDNIMRHIQTDGRVVYKLADFGTARELPEGENFNSIHGTEPYLNPKLYKVVFFKQMDRKFDCDTDLWSIGVTLYQTATGNLPFSIRQRHVMLHIYNELKADEGILSAVQDRNSENVIYKKNLPETCPMSHGLQKHVRAIISGLFLQEKSKQWSFTRYYNEVSKLLSRRLINVFYVNKMQNLNVYLEDEESFDDFKHEVGLQTAISEENQVFLYKRSLIVSRFEDLHQVEPQDCVFLFDRSNSDVIPSYTKLIFDNLYNFHNDFMSDDSNRDLQLAEIACKDLCLCKMFIDYEISVTTLFSRFINDFDAYCKQELEEERTLFNVLLEKYLSSVSSGVKTLENLQDIINGPKMGFVEEFKNATEIYREDACKLFDTLSAITPARANRILTQESYLNIVVEELSDLKSLTKRLPQMNLNKMSYFYVKIQIVHCVRTIMDILVDKVNPNFEDFVRDVQCWYKKEFFSKLRGLRTLKKSILQYRKDLKVFEEEIALKSNENIKVLSAINTKASSKKFLEKLNAYAANNGQISVLVEENLKLMEEIKDLVLDLSFSADY